ncbi:MAG: hypothetical protein R3C40_09655 [Parvularculaceae bacterium]
MPTRSSSACSKSSLAAHGAFGNRGYFRLQAGEIGKLVNAFLLDNGGSHIGDDEPFFASRRRLDDDVDRRLAQHVADGGDGLALSMASPMRKSSATPSAWAAFDLAGEFQQHAADIIGDVVIE